MRFLFTTLFCLYLSTCLLAQDKTKVMITTSFGDMLIELYDETPLHRDNFIKLVTNNFYDGTLFHRVIPNFMIQGGDPDSKGAKPGIQLGNGGPGYTVPAEFVDELFHKKGVLAAARLGDAVNPNKESSGSQFYIVQGQVYSEEKLWSFSLRSGKKYTKEQIKSYTTVGGTPHLDGGYTVFGEVVKGLEVIEAIANVKRDENNRPLNDLKMSIKIYE